MYVLTWPRQIFFLFEPAICIRLSIAYFVGLFRRGTLSITDSVIGSRVKNRFENKKKMSFVPVRKQSYRFRFSLRKQQRIRRRKTYAQNHTTERNRLIPMRRGRRVAFLASPASRPRTNARAPPVIASPGKNCQRNFERNSGRGMFARRSAENSGA